MPGDSACTPTRPGPGSAAASCCSVACSCAMPALVAPYAAYCCVEVEVEWGLGWGAVGL